MQIAARLQNIAHLAIFHSFIWGRMTPQGGNSKDKKKYRADRDRSWLVPAIIIEYSYSNKELMCVYVHTCAS